MLAIGLLAGCGGAGVRPDSEVSSLAGLWTGTWTSDAGDIGAATVTINNQGQLTGQTRDTTIGMTGSLQGSITGNQCSVSLSFPDKPDCQMTGTLILGSDHLMTVRASGTVNSSAVSDTFILSKTATVTSLRL